MNQIPEGKVMMPECSIIVDNATINFRSRKNQRAQRRDAHSAERKICVSTNLMRLKDRPYLRRLANLMTGSLQEATSFFKSLFIWNSLMRLHYSNLCRWR